MADTPAQAAPARQPGPLVRPHEGRVKAPPKAGAEAHAAHQEGAQPHHAHSAASGPFRRAWAFIKGTIYDMFDRAANIGYVGFYLGLAGGVLAFFASGGAAPLLGTVALWAVSGTLGGMGLGAAIGVLTGGMRGVQRSERKEAKAVREDEQNDAVPRGYNYRDVMDRNNTITNYNYDRAQQIMRENQRDDSYFWRDRIDNEHHHGHHRGF